MKKGKIPIFQTMSECGRIYFYLWLLLHSNLCYFQQYLRFFYIKLIHAKRTAIFTKPFIFVLCCMSVWVANEVFFPKLKLIIWRIYFWKCLIELVYFCYHCHHIVSTFLQHNNKNKKKETGRRNVPQNDMISNYFIIFFSLNIKFVSFLL